MWVPLEIIGDRATSVRLKSSKPKVQSHAAEQGHARAQYNLGLMYDDGQGVEQGHVWAQYNLGLMHSIGRGVLMDMEKAYYWFYLAAAQGSEQAEKHRDEAACDLSRDQITEAERKAQEWMAKHQR